MSRKKIDAQIKKIIIETIIDAPVLVETAIIEEYKELNDKCDTVITKIKKRKNSRLKVVPNA